MDRGLKEFVEDPGVALDMIWTLRPWYFCHRLGLGHDGHVLPSIGVLL